jgi:hypothetical protein
MGSRVALAAVVTLLAVVPASSARSLANTWSGMWESAEWGEMTLTQSGSRVTGTYVYQSGRIEGTVTGAVLKGRWTEVPTRKGPSDAGAFEFTLTADGKSFKGRWNYAGSPTSWSTNWNGTCKAGACLQNTGTAGGGGGGGGGTTTTTGSGSAAAPPTATATGAVTVNGRPFTGGTVPYGSTVDVTSGRLTLKTGVGTLTVNGASGISAVFKLVRTTVKKKPLVELRLTRGNFGVCPKRKTSAASQTGTTTVRQLWGNGTGSFRTRGRYGAATVRGTRWLTADRCDGTRVQVSRGVVSVSDFAQRREVTVRAGGSYLAKP